MVALGQVEPQTLKMVAAASVLCSQNSGLDLEGLYYPTIPGRGTTSTSGDDGSNAETNFTSYGIVTFRGL